MVKKGGWNVRGGKKKVGKKGLTYCPGLQMYGDSDGQEGKLLEGGGGGAIIHAKSE